MSHHFDPECAVVLDSPQTKCNCITDGHYVQTRNDDGAKSLYPTIREAFKAAEDDLTIWNISWTDRITNERVRLVVDTNEFGKKIWKYSPIMVQLKYR